ncbi:MAG: hypothetical protein ACHP9Z_33770, partial [Streptosporangiales bacterium]
YRAAAGLPFSPSAALRGTLRAMTGQLPSDVDLLPGEFAEWFPLSVLSIVVTGGDLGRRGVAAPVAAAVLPGPAAAGAGSRPGAPVGE